MLFLLSIFSPGLPTDLTLFRPVLPSDNNLSSVLFPPQAWTQLHTHQRSICTGDSECGLRPVPASASVSTESLHLALIVMADLSLLIFCAHSTKAPPTPVTTHDASV